MTVAEDASTPSVTRSATSFTTSTIVSASFTPPTGSLLVVMVNLGYANNWTTAPTLAVAGGSLTYTLQASEIDNTNKFLASGIWTAPVVSSPGAMTVTFTRTGTLGAAGGQLAVRVLTGASTTIGTVLSTLSITSATVQASMSALSIGSQIYYTGSYDSAGTFTPVASTSTLDTWNDSTDAAALGIGKSTSLTSGTGAVTYGWTNTGTAPTDDTINQGIEIQPAVVAAGRPRPIDVVTGMSVMRAANY